jgi:alpha-2-macroglobulin
VEKRLTRKITLFTLTGLLLIAIAAAVPPQGDAGAYSALKAEAEKFYAEKSFSRAHELYEKALQSKPPADEVRWMEFRLADTTWRADAASPDPDPTKRDAARVELERLAQTRPPDRVSAEANESLGDYWSMHPFNRAHEQSQRWYLAALDYWAGSSDLELARKRYLSIIWRVAGEYHWNVPQEVLVNAVQIAQTTEEKAHARVLLAQRLERGGGADGVERAFELYEEVLRLGRTEWYDDALYLYGKLLMEWSDRVTQLKPEDQVPPADYDKALELFRRLQREFKASESEYHDDAGRAIAQISKVMVNVYTDMTFVPDSDQRIGLAWRNAKSVELTFYSVDLVNDIQRKERDHEWKSWVRLGDQPVARRWTYETNTADFSPGQELIDIEPRLPPGAYLVTARAAGAELDREIVVVTDAHILVHGAGDRASVLISDVETGEPIANARVRAWTHKVTDPPQDATTDANGLATFKVGQQGIAFFAASGPNNRQAWHQAYVAPYSRHRGDQQWRIYAFTDRPAYRPNETVQWKFIARARENDRWITPVGSVEYTITSGRGEKVAEGVAKLNAYGSFWSELALTPEMQLGEYAITFRIGDRHVGQAQLFRLEEYKLPEFTVSVSTPEGTQYRLGDTIEATIDASYYFGGPVANATVEAVVYSQPLYRYWYPWREYHWYYPPIHDGYRHEEQQITQTLQTDATGRAILRIPTRRDGTDMNYRIEARVVDASRREVRGTGSVRVTRQRYSVMVQPEHYIHRPGDPARIAFKAMDANDKPVRTTGEVTVVRRTWKETKYVDDEVLTTKLDTDANGEATLTFTPKTTGYYAIRWKSHDGEGNRARDIVSAETTIWVADRNSTEIGYHQNGLVELIVDKETIRPGETANVLVVTPSAGRWVLFSSSSDSILDTRVLKMDGTAKLVQITLDERHVPNFFVTASSVFGMNVDTDSERLVVPPVEHFIKVGVKSDREQYEPRQEGTLTITTRSVDGKPVPAEVAVSVTDEAVTAIQTDPAGDPRQVFFGDQHYNNLNVSAALHSQRYVKLKSEEEEAREQKEREEQGVAGGVEGGVVGGVVGGSVGGMVRQRRDGFIGDAVQETSVEAITVTASAPAMNQPAPAPPPPPPAAVAPQMGKGAADAAANPIAVQVRSDFRSTAFWKPDVVTDANGTATIRVNYPEALTTWRATARAVTTGSMFGIGSSTARTQLPLLVRLQAPRFFVVGDRTTISAVINNNTDEAMSVTPSLEIEGLTMSGTPAGAPVQVPARGEARADWTVTADRAGAAKLRVTARGAAHGDAMAKSFLVYEHGIDKLIARSGKLRGSEALVRLDLPRERRATDLTVQIAPSLAVTMLDALPYLIEFPYGCTEQTMSRFLPAAIVARTLEKLGLDVDDRRSRLSGQAGLPDLHQVTAAGIKRLFDMQHPNGAWGWWKEGPDDAWMTAYVVWGFSIARDAGLPFDANRIDRAASWLRTQLIQRREQFNEQAWMLHALSAWVAKPSAEETKTFNHVYTNREKLSAYSRALLALTAHRYGETERANVLVRNLEDGVKLERTPDQSVLLKGETTAETMATAHWGADRFWWRWHEGPIETTAFVLKALVTIDPKHRLVEPAMNWLVKNRRGAQWTNTRDTAIALLALNEYLEQSGELRGDVAYELTVNGRVVATHTVTPAEVLRAPSRFSVEAELLTDATQEIRIRRTGGTGPIYFSAEARFVSLEEPVKPAGNEMFVQREYFRLRPRPTLLKGVQYDRLPLRDGESIRSGERVEVVVTVDVKNDYEYLLFEDLKPAGLEAVELQSGQPMFATQERTGTTAFVYQELRDRKVALFADRLQQGIWKMNYSLRAEVPGTFHALPLLGQAMYVPDIRANGEEVRITVTD